MRHGFRILFSNGTLESCNRMVLHVVPLVVSNCTTWIACTTILAIDYDVSVFPCSACVDRVSQLNYFLHIQATDSMHFYGSLVFDVVKNEYFLSQLLHEITVRGCRLNKQHQC